MQVAPTEMPPTQRGPRVNVPENGDMQEIPLSPPAPEALTTVRSTALCWLFLKWLLLLALTPVRRTAIPYQIPAVYCQLYLRLVVSCLAGKQTCCYPSLLADAQV